MTDNQILTIALATVPNMLAVLAAILINNSRLGDLKNDMNLRIGEVRADLGNLRADMNRQFSDTRELWRAELHRVEEILDARLKHLEER